MDAPPVVSLPIEVINATLQKTETVLADPSTIDHLFAHIANGGDLITFCSVLQIRYSDVAAWITRDQARHKRYSEAAQMGMEWIKQRILNELRCSGMVDIRSILNKDGTVMDPSEWPEETARAIAGIEVEDNYTGKGDQREKVGTTTKVKLIDKTKALEMMGKELGMFVQRNKVEVVTRLEDLVGGSFETEEPPTPAPPGNEG